MKVKSTLVISLYIISFLLIFCLYPGTFPYISLVIAFFLFGTLMLQNPGKIKKDILLFLLCLLFIIEFLVSLLISVNEIKHFVYAISYCSIIISISKFSITRKRIDSLVKIILIAAFIGGPIIGIIQLVNGEYIFNSGLIDNESYFMTTIISNANHANSNYVAIGMLFCVTLAGYLFIRSRKSIYAIAFIFAAICTLLTYSRTAIFILIVEIVLYTLLTIKKFDNNKRNNRIKVLIFLAVIIIFFITYDFISNLVLGYFLEGNVEKILSIKQSSTLSLRSNQWSASIELFLNGGWKSIIGYGDNAPIMLGSISGRVMSAHNFILGRLSETGIIGLIIAISIYIFTFKETIVSWKKVEKSDLWVNISTIGILICYLMISNITWELIIILTLFNVLNRLNKQHEKRSNND